MSSPANQSVCGSCRWCLQVPLATRVLEYIVNLDDGEQSTDPNLLAWIADAYPPCPPTITRSP